MAEIPARNLAAATRYAVKDSRFKKAQKKEGPGNETRTFFSLRGN
jgi:hypothetical protein